MNKTLNVNFHVCAFLLAFFALSVHKIAFSQNNERQQKAAAEAIMNEINNAKPNRQGQTQREASIEAAQELAKKRIEKATTNDAKFNEAVNFFRGYYLINAFSRPAYCKTYNVSIDRFTQEFINAYRYEFEIIRQHEIKNSLPKNTAKLLDEILAKQVATEMETTAKQSNMSVADYCRDIRDYAPQHVKLLDLKTRAPTVYQQLYK